MLEQRAKFVQSGPRVHQKDASDLVLESLIVNFETLIIWHYGFI